MPTLQHLGSDKSEIASIGAGLGASAAPVEEAEGVLGVPGHAEGVDEAGGEDGLLEAVGAALAVERGEDQADGAEVVAGLAEGVEELAELGALLGGGLALLHPVEEADEDAELGVAGHFRRPAARRAPRPIDRARVFGLGMRFGEDDDERSGRSSGEQSGSGALCLGFGKWFRV